MTSWSHHCGEKAVGDTARLVAKCKAAGMRLESYSYLWEDGPKDPKLTILPSKIVAVQMHYGLGMKPLAHRLFWGQSLSHMGLKEILALSVRLTSWCFIVSIAVLSVSWI